MHAGDVIRYFGLVLGLTLVIAFVSITAPIRRFIARRSAFLAALVYCWTCAGFWVGVALAGYYPFGAAFDLPASAAVAVRIIESGLCAMAFMFIASQLLTGGTNPAFDAEQGAPHDEEKETTNG